MRFFVTSGMRAHRVGMPTTGAGQGNCCALYCKLCFVTGEWVTRGKIVASVAAISLSVCTLGYYQEL
jgi:hypothetical protein